MVETKLVAVEEPRASPGSALVSPSLRNKCTPAAKVGRSQWDPKRCDATRLDRNGLQLSEQTAYLRYWADKSPVRFSEQRSAAQRTRADAN